jgi:hypothetical protein
MVHDLGLNAWHVGRTSREEHLTTELINGAWNPVSVPVNAFHSSGSKERLVGTSCDHQPMLDIGLRIA